MQFNDQVTQTLTDKPPKGWPEKLFVTEYAELDDERKTYYGAVYARYRTKKYRDYDEYGSFAGWAETRVGVGKPVGYKYHDVITAKVVQSVLHSSVITSRILRNMK